LEGLKIVGYKDIVDTIEFFENYNKRDPEIFNKLNQAWSIARPIKAVLSEVEDLFIGIKDLKKKINEAKNISLYPGGIYSIFSEKTKFGMGKSQFAYFLQKEFEKNSKLIMTHYHYLSPSKEGFRKLEVELKNCLSKSTEVNSFYFFIDEIDLISKPGLSEEEIAKRIENLTNILIEISEEAFNTDQKFYIFLVLSKTIQDDFERLVSNRITRRITPFISVDILFTEEHIEKLATRFFSTLWVSNYKSIQDKFDEHTYKFQEIISSMISDFRNNLEYLGLNVKSSVIGDYVKKFRNIFSIILDGVSEKQVRSAKLSNERVIGTEVEELFKEYLLSRNKSFKYEENGHQIKIEYIRDNKQIGKHKTDGYYDFLIGDTSIGIMPVEITTQKDLRGGKKEQIKTFTEKHDTLLIWMFPDRNQVKKELNRINEKILVNSLYKLYELIIPRDFVKYALILEERRFSFLEELKEDIIGDIQIYLTKYAKYLFNRWVLETPITDEYKADVKEVDRGVNDIQERVGRLFDNLFSSFGDKNRKSHGLLIKKLREEVEYLNKGLNLENDFLNIENIYREILEKLEKEHLGRYKKPYSNKTFFIKENRFTDKEAIKICTPIITSRIKTKIKK